MNLSGDTPMLVKSARLRLRSVTMADKDTVIRLRTDPRIFYWKKSVETEEHAYLWLRIRLESPDFLTCVIELLPERAAQPSAVGLLGAHRLPEIGYILDPAHWGKGVATEALQAWLSWYWNKFPNGHFRTADGSKAMLTAETGPDAASSRRVLRKCGFQPNGQRETMEEGELLRLDCWILSRPVVRVATAENNDCA